MWLPADAAPRVTRLLDDANPDAAFRPADPGAGRWCGVESGRESGAELVAVACETWPSAHIAQLSSLAVHPTARRRGLGAAVTAFFVGEALAAGAPSVILGVENANHGGRALYDRLGFSAWPLAGVTAG
jgi:ribosomal protein S18 acetylase RimI-like enzyme